MKNLNKESDTRAEVESEQLLQEILCRLSEQQIASLLIDLGWDSPAGISLRKRLEKQKQFRWMQDISDDFTIQDALRIELESNHNYRNEFFEELIRFVDRAQKTDAQVYNAIGMNRTLWYRLRDNKDARTSKRNVLKMAIVLQLDYWELYYLVNLAGYSFVPNYDVTDRVISFCVRHQIYDTMQIDALLNENREQTLFTEE